MIKKRTKTLLKLMWGFTAILFFVIIVYAGAGTKMTFEEAMVKKEAKRRIAADQEKQEVNIDQLEKEKYKTKVEINIAKIREELKTDSPSMRRSILELKLAQDKRATSVLIEVIHVSDYAVLREEAAETLGSIGDKKAVPELIKILDDKDYQVKLAAAGALVKLGEIDRAFPMLKDIAQKKDYLSWPIDMRIKTRGAWQQEQAKRCREESLPMKALQILGQLGTQPCLEILQNSLNDDNSILRIDAAYWLLKNRYAEQSALQAIDGVIANPNNSALLRISAINRLSEAPKKAACQILEKYQYNQETQIAQSAQKLLKIIRSAK